jgi:hypothetical protein
MFCSVHIGSSSAVAAITMTTAPREKLLERSTGVDNCELTIEHKAIRKHLEGKKDQNYLLIAGIAINRPIGLRPS